MTFKKAHHTYKHGKGCAQREKPLKHFTFERIGWIADYVVTLWWLHFEKVISSRNVGSYDLIAKKPESLYKQALLRVKGAPHGYWPL